MLLFQIKPFTDQYNWKEIRFLSNKKDWKRFESNNNTIALDTAYVPYDSEKIRCIYFKT